VFAAYSDMPHLERWAKRKEGPSRTAHGPGEEEGEPGKKTLFGKKKDGMNLPLG